MTRDELIEAGRRVADEVGPAATRSDFKRLTGIDVGHIYRHFPTRYEIEQSGVISPSTIQRRLGKLSEGALQRYREWLTARYPESPLLSALPILSDNSDNKNSDACLQDSLSLKPGQEWEGTEGQVYGAPIQFRGLRHAPINEQGVVFLFGMVAEDLGFQVEAIQGGFPDCEAKRCIDTRRNRWQRTRIEFEFRSSEFRRHGHPINGCDVIVCWIHDWPECPLEVVELSQVVGILQDK
jgi:AcrR family transcriptional regulator